MQEDDWLSAAAAELQYRAGFEPLMHLLPSPENQKPGWDISWSPRDEHLRQVFVHSKSQQLLA